MPVQATNTQTITSNDTVLDAVSDVLEAAGYSVPDMGEGEADSVTVRIFKAGDVNVTVPLDATFEIVATDTEVVVA